MAAEKFGSKRNKGDIKVIATATFTEQINYQ